MTAPGPRGISRAAWSALLVALVADALLAPFYPQFFAATFGGDGVVTAGLYIALCRIAVVVSLPLWTRWTRKIPPLRLVARAQVIAGVAALGCAAAPSLASFLVLTFVAEAARAAYLLLYPALYEAAPAEQRGAVIARVAASFHAAALIAALAGGAMLEQLGGRTALVIAAGFDFLQLACLIPVLKYAPSAAREETTAATALPSPAVRAAVRRRLVMLCALTFLSTVAFVLLRPYFTTFLSEGLMPGSSLSWLGAVFVVPSIVAVLVLPLGDRIARAPRLSLYLVLALAAMAVTAAGQAAAATLAVLIGARVVYGLACYVVDIAVDKAALGEGDSYGRFGMVQAVQNTAIVIAPLLAARLADGSSWTLLFGSAVALSTVAALAAVCLRARPFRVPSAAAPGDAPGAPVSAPPPGDLAPATSP